LSELRNITRGLRRETDNEALSPLSEDCGLVMSEKQSANNLTGAGFDRRREVAAHRQMARWHSAMGCVFSIARISENISDADNAFTAKGRSKHRGVSRHGKVCERVPGDAREGVQSVSLPVIIHRVVEKRTELRAGNLTRRVGYLLHNFFHVPLGDQEDA
jgi:hypothetical protein